MIESGKHSIVDHTGRSVKVDEASLACGLRVGTGIYRAYTGHIQGIVLCRSWTGHMQGKEAQAAEGC